MHLWDAKTPRRGPAGRPATPRSRRSTTSPAAGSPRRRRPRWPATRGRPTRRSGTGSRLGARSAAPTRSPPIRRRWPPTSPSGPRPASLSTVQASAAATAAAARSAGRADPTKTPLVADTLRGIARQHAAVPAAAPRQAAALDYATALDLMRAAGRPQRRGRGRESPAAAAARGRRDAAIVALAFCAGLRRSEIAALVWGDITPTARGGQLRVRVRASKANADGRREDLRLLAGPFVRAVEDLRTAEEPAAAERVVPLGPHQVNRRLQVLARSARSRGRLVALRTPGAGRGAGPPRRLDHRRAGRRRLAQRHDGRPLRLGRRRRGRSRRQALRGRRRIGGRRTGSPARRPAVRSRQAVPSSGRTTITTPRGNPRKHGGDAVYRRSVIGLRRPVVPSGSARAA